MLGPIGLAVILSGDPYQLQPVGSKSLYSSVVDDPDLINRKSRCICPSTIGANLFYQFVLYELTEQMRTQDQLTHIDLIERLQNPSIAQPVNLAFIQSLIEKQLAPRDARQDPDWACAPIVVTLNEFRANINYNMACRFAQQYKLPFIKWRLPISGIRAAALSGNETNQLYYQETNLWGYFVVKAPNYLTSNINPSKRLANGTEILYDSRSFIEDKNVD